MFPASGHHLMAEDEQQIAEDSKSLREETEIKKETVKTQLKELVS